MKKKSSIWIKSIFVLTLLSIVLTGCPPPVDEDSNVTDFDGNTYKTVVIGSQTWMAENLKTTKYNDGTPIPLVTDPTTWINLKSSAYCWYNNDATTNKNIYGAIYNWHVVNTGKLCPKGWHVPSDTEWSTLTTFLGGELMAAFKLKEVGASHWVNPNSGTNESGFKALPGGNCAANDGSFGNVGLIGYWWSTTAYGSGTPFAWERRIVKDGGEFYRVYSNYTFGISVRCLKD